MPIFPIGVQQILPRPYTRWKAPKGAPYPPADAERDQAPPKPEEGQTPAAEPRSGHILDTIA